jgi:hypothetical protein
MASLIEDAGGYWNGYNFLDQTAHETWQPVPGEYTED